MEFYLRLKSTAGEEQVVVLILLNRKDRNCGMPIRTSLLILLNWNVGVLPYLRLKLTSKEQVVVLILLNRNDRDGGVLP